MGWALTFEYNPKGETGEAGKDDVSVSSRTLLHTATTGLDPKLALMLCKPFRTDGYDGIEAFMMLDTRVADYLLDNETHVVAIHESFLCDAWRKSKGRLEGFVENRLWSRWTGRIGQNDGLAFCRQYNKPLVLHTCLALEWLEPTVADLPRCDFIEKRHFRIENEETPEFNLKRAVEACARFNRIYPNATFGITLDFQHFVQSYLAENPKAIWDEVLSALAADLDFVSSRYCQVESVHVCGFEPRGCGPKGGEHLPPYQGSMPVAKMLRMIASRYPEGIDLVVEAPGSLANFFALRAGSRWAQKRVEDIAIRSLDFVHRHIQ